MKDVDRRSFLATALILTLLFCFCAAPSRCSAAEDAGDKLDKYAAAILGSFGDSVEAIQKKLGKPSIATAEKSPNPHYPEYTDVITTMKYDGVELAVYKSGYPGSKPFVIWLHCKTAKRKLRHFNVGGKVAGVRGVLGAPDDMEQSYVKYNSDLSGLSFQITPDGTITEIEGYIFPD